MKPENYFMRLLFAVIVINSFLVINCYSQPSIQWQWLYPGPYDLDDYGYGICASTDGNYFLSGVARGIGYPNNFYVIKINPYGQIIWSRAIGGTTGTGTAYSVAPTLGGGCVATGDAARFLKFNANGDTIINKVLTNAGRKLFDIKRTVDNYFIACGSYNIDQALVVKFDSLGNLLWEKVYASTFEKLLYSIEEGIDGGYIAVGRSKDFWNDPIKLFIVKVNENGDSLWIRQFGSNISGVSINKSNSNYIISGQRTVTKIDILGNIYVTFPIDSLQPAEQVKDMKLLSPNRFVYATTDFVNSDSIYSKLILGDSSGNIIRVKEINFSNFIDLNEIEICSNSDLIFMGYAAANDTSSKAIFFALRTDSLFNFPPVSVIGITQISNSIPSGFTLYQNYPNPFNSSTVIEFDLDIADFYEMEIYDILGKKISIILNEYKNPGKYKIILDLANLSSGAYFYTIANSKQKITRNFILIK
jgi:hypothetical protein